MNKAHALLSFNFVHQYSELHLLIHGVAACNVTTPKITSLATMSSSGTYHIRQRSDLKVQMMLSACLLLISYVLVRRSRLLLLQKVLLIVFPPILTHSVVALVTNCFFGLDKVVVHRQLSGVPFVALH